MLRNLHRALLERLGFDVLIADSGKAAAEIARDTATPIRLMIFDPGMPKPNSLEPIGTVRHLRPQTPVILISGYDESQFPIDTPADKPDAFLQKPFQKSDLQKAIVRVLRGS